MAIAQSVHIIDEVVDFLISNPTLEEIIAFHPSEATQERLRMLLDHNRNNELTEVERLELDQMSRVNHIFILIKARARKRLNEINALKNEQAPQ